MYDLVIKNGVVLDGTGGEPRRVDVGIAADKISALGPDLGDQGRQVIDAAGLLVAPGFIDVHSHCDLLPFMVGQIKYSRVLQGVTTELVGQCGLGPAPYLEENMQNFRQYLKAILGSPEVDWNWRRFSGYLEALSKAKKPHNVAALVSHGAVRAQVLGLGDVQPTENDIAHMQAIVREAMEDGALGISFGLAYLPGVFAPKEELVALCRVVAEYDGIMMVHIRSHSRQVVEAMQEALDIAQASGVRLQISHMRSYANRRFGISGGQLLEMIDSAREQGVDVTFDQHPYLAGSTLLTQILPPWAKAGGGQQIVNRLRNRDVLERLRYDLYNSDCSYPGWDNFVGMVGWENILVSSVQKPENKHLQGKTMAEIAEELGVDAVEAAARLLISENAECCMVMLNLFSDQDIIELVSHPLSQIGSDGIPTGTPHPRLYGTYPKFLGTYVRDKKVMSWPEAIKRLTGDPATRLNLRDRGFLKAGLAADIVIFDPEAINDKEDYSNPAQIPEGISYVVVNGRITVQKGKIAAEDAGQVISCL
ncbi:N-acyl-D-amino-acid deacylase family protein [Zhaonella formicivorans]|uniref:N-acyl-D-amino-acid deacylase family protein n=1 Tax=Zhaonella formicivorans TaxID=2528593 RepID=UPI0010ECC284|nr:D-aminoacylase [Zhaonella formicivorans]